MGIVVTRSKLVYCLMNQNKVLKQGDTANEMSAIRLSISLLLHEFNLAKEQMLICAEHAGQYNYPLIYICENENYRLWLENPNKIKFYCSGLQPSKNYRLNSKQIAVYASRNADKINNCRQPISEVEHLKQLHNELNMLQTDSAKLQSQLFDQRNYMSEEVFNVNATRLIVLIKGLEEAIATVEDEIKCIFAGNKFLSQQMELLTSIEGVEHKVALKMIVETDAFTRFDNYRQFCSHVGIAPLKTVLKANQHFQYPVNVKLDKGIKTLLNEAALSIIKKKDSELRDYFIRKLKEGKDERLVLNAIRVKLVARMFAVIKANQKYQPKYSIG
jgi:transposase